MLRIKKIVATNVHGYIPLNITFKSTLTFLTGSNGSGKTTALKLLSSILEPNFDLLNNIDFDDVKLTCWVDDLIYDITLIKRDNIIDWTISFKNRLKKSKDESRLSIKKGVFKLYPKGESFGYNRDVSDNFRKNIKSNFLTSGFYETINSFSTPLFLGIDRKIIGKFNPTTNYKYSKYKRYQSHRITGDTGFSHAQDEILNFISGKVGTEKKLIENFKLNIFKSLFKYLPYKKSASIFSYTTERELLNKKDAAIRAIESLELGQEILDEVEQYFNEISVLQKKLQLEDSKTKRSQNTINEWLANRPHLKRIEAISQNAEKYQSEIDKLDKPLTEITNITNSFFKESNKQLTIGANGIIRVNYNDKKISSRSLSSGEMQLIVIIIHLVFCENRGDSTVFVIDEPELSLHISWQEKFVNAIMLASPSTQFILATHSPAIISKLEYEKKCVFLKTV